MTSPLARWIQDRADKEESDGIQMFTAPTRPKLCHFLKESERVLKFANEEDLFESDKLTGIEVQPIELNLRMQNIPDLEGRASAEEEEMLSKTITKAEKKEMRDAQLSGWYGLKKREITPEMELELEAIRLRGVIDNSDLMNRRKVILQPKHFAVATVVNGDRGVGVNTNVTSRSKKRRRKTIMKQLGILGPSE